MLRTMFSHETWQAVPFHFWSVWVFVFGSMVGSFLNVCIHRMPLGKFFTIEILALTVWGCFLTTLGFCLSNMAAALIGTIKSMERWMLGALGFIILGALVARLFTRYEIRKRLLSRREDS